MKPAALLFGLLFAAAYPGVGAPRAEPAPAPGASAPADTAARTGPPAGNPPPAASLTAAEAQQVLDLLRDPVKRGQLVTALEGITKALPAPAAREAAAAPVPASATGPRVELAPDSIGAQLVREGPQRLSLLSAETIAGVRSITDFPMLWRWTRDIAADRGTQKQLVRAGWRLLLVLGIGVAAERLVGWALRRPRRLVCEHGPPASWHDGREPDGAGGEAARAEHADFDAAEAAAEAGETEPRRWRPSALATMRRVPFVLLAFALDLIPLGAFLACCYAILAAIEAEPNARLAILSVVHAYVTWRLVLGIAFMLLEPAMPRMRLVHVSSVTAAKLVRWTGLIVGVAVFGRTVAEVTELYGLYPIAAQALFKLFMLADHLLLLALVLQSRRAVAERIRDHTGRTGSVARARNLLARTWHYIAIFYIVALWLVWAFEVPGGYSRLLRVFVVTAAMLLAARLVAILLLGALDRGMRIRPDLAARFPELETRAHRYHAILHRLLSASLGVLTVFVLLYAWGLDVDSWFSADALGGRALWALLVVVLTLVASVFVWEAANLSIQRHLRLLTEGGQGARAGRLRTLMPILRAVLLVTVGSIAALTALAEIGVNIGPLLAGAGILGVAVGFGSQKLVQDFITGIFLLFENTMQVGDWVTVAGLSGTVENLSIRTIRLRGADGSVYTIPFSAVTTVNNTNRGLGNAAVSVNVSYREDTDRVGQVLKDIAAEMRREPGFERQMLGELDLWGVDKIDGATVTISGQIVCTDAGRWAVQREFNRRVKRRFQELGIEVGIPAQAVVLQRDSAESDGNGAAPTGAELPAAPVPAAFLPAAGGSRR